MLSTEPFEFSFVEASYMSWGGFRLLCFKIKDGFRLFFCPWAQPLVEIMCRGKMEVEVS